MPPDHSTAASGTLPTEQTKLSTAMSEPTITFSIVGKAAKERVPEAVPDHVEGVRTSRYQIPLGGRGYLIHFCP
jgi:hypothetical protein